MKEITCAVVSPGLPSWVCSLSWTLSAELLEGGAEEGRAPPAGAAGVGRGGLAAMAGLAGRLPMGRSETEGFGWRGRGRSGWMRSSALKGCLGSVEYRSWEREQITRRHFVELCSETRWDRCSGSWWLKDRNCGTAAESFVCPVVTGLETLGGLCYTHTATAHSSNQGSCWCHWLFPMTHLMWLWYF